VAQSDLRTPHNQRTTYQQHFSQQQEEQHPPGAQHSVSTSSVDMIVVKMGQEDTQDEIFFDN
jgi:hypothetical protein